MSTAAVEASPPMVPGTAPATSTGSDGAGGGAFAVAIELALGAAGKPVGTGAGQASAKPAPGTAPGGEAPGDTGTDDVATGQADSTLAGLLSAALLAAPAPASVKGAGATGATAPATVGAAVAGATARLSAKQPTTGAPLPADPRTEDATATPAPQPPAAAAAAATDPTPAAAVRTLAADRRLPRASSLVSPSDTAPGSAPTSAPSSAAIPGPGTPPATPVSGAGGPTQGASPPAHRAVAAQVIPEVTRLFTNGEGVHRVTLELNPKALGEVRVVLTVRHGDVHVRLAAGSDARQAMALSAGDLTRALEHVGVKETRLTLAELPGVAAGAGAQTPHDSSDARQQSAPFTGGFDTHQQHEARHSRMGDDRPATDGTPDHHGARTSGSRPIHEAGHVPSRGALDLRM